MQLAVCFRKRLTEEGISERASDLIVSSRKEDTLSTYSSAWNKWVSWCVEQNVDTSRCNVNWILNFITFLFESGYEYRTILHLGQQFELCITTLRENLLESTSSLITGVFNKRLPQPRYSVMWDVQLVLDYLKKEVANNSDFSDKFKGGMLLALLSASRIRSLHILDTKFMAKTSQKYVFKFHNLHKSWRQGQKPTTLEFAAFPQGKEFCIVWTEEWRRMKQ